MMLEMMAPVNQQLNEMKILYESTRATSGDLEGKITDLKKIMSGQMATLQSGNPLSAPQAGQGGSSGGMF